MASKRPSLAFLITIAVPAFAASAAWAGPVNPDCISDSTLAKRIDSQPCGRFKSRATRFEEIGGVETEIFVDWMEHKPKGKPKGVAVLLMGGEGEAKIEKAAKGSAVAPGVTSNFLVRSGQLFAEAGYFAVSVDSPEDAMGVYLYTADFATSDAYRVSPKATQDLATVLAKANGSKNLPVFLVGTSRGANLAAAKHPLSVGVALPSPITAASGGSPAYVDAAAAASIGTPVHVLSNIYDDLGTGCLAAQRSAALALNFSGDTILSGTVNRFDDLFSTLISGGVCDALAPHGFYGIENAAVTKITGWMDDVLATLPANTRPSAKRARKSVKLSDGILQVDLSKLAKDKDGDALTFSLPHAVSSRGAPISLTTTVVSYTPVQAGIVDGFVYVVSDAKGGRSHNVVTVKVQ
jgi:hypothetical protein